MRKIEERIIKAINRHEKIRLSKRDMVDSMVGKTDVYLHSTIIASIYKGHIIINSGSWRTNTTKSRLNAILHEYTNCAIMQEDWAWYVIERLTPGGWMTDKSSRKDFTDGMSIPRVR